MKCLAYPSQDSSQYEWEKEKNEYQMYLDQSGKWIHDHTNVEKEIAELVPILVGYSHLHKLGLWSSLVRIVAQKFDAKC